MEASMEGKTDMLLEEVLVAVLEAVDGLHDRVCPIEDIQKSTGPLAVYEQQSEQEEACIDGAAGLLTASFKIHVFHGTYQKMRLLAEKVKEKIKSLRQRTEGIFCIEEVTVTMAHPDLQENRVQLFRRAYLVTIQYQIKEDN